MTKIHHIINTHKQLIKSTQLYYLLINYYYVITNTIMTKIHHIINTHKQLIKSTQLYYLLINY